MRCLHDRLTHLERRTPCGFSVASARLIGTTERLVLGRLTETRGCMIE